MRIFERMGRRLRQNHPGMPFHVTARMQGREPLLCGMEQDVVELIERHAARRRVQVAAYAVMPNHLHLLVVQGREPLGSFMQGLLRHVALQVLRRYSREGHAFERRYFATLCSDPSYFRNAVAYIHLNPIRAAICSDADSYAWTTHALYAGVRKAPGTLLEIAALNALRVFSMLNECDVTASRADYRRFMDWRLLADAHIAAGGLTSDPSAPPLPDTRGGDDSWFSQYGTAAMCAPAAPSRRADLRDVVQAALNQLEPGMPLDVLCSGNRSKPLVSIRREVIARCLAAGHAPGRIARFLGVSTTTVCRSTPA